MITVPKGFATYFGAVLGFALYLIPYLGELESALAPAGVPVAVWPIIGGVLHAIVLVGRYVQAVTMIKDGPIMEPIPQIGGANEPTDPDISF